MHKGVGYLRTGENFLSVIKIEKENGKPCEFTKVQLRVWRGQQQGGGNN